MSDEVKAAFEQQNNGTLNILRSGDAGEMVNKAILAKDAPLADVMYGVDNTFLSRALDAGIFEPYQSPALVSNPGPSSRSTRRTACRPSTSATYASTTTQRRSVEALPHQRPSPTSLTRLTRTSWWSKTQRRLPQGSHSSSLPSCGSATSRARRPRRTPAGIRPGRSTGSSCSANGVLVSDNWEDAYYNQFSGGAGEGDRPIVVSYATSPASEVVGASPAPETPPTANIDDGCFRQIEFVGLLAGARPEAKPLAQKWIDFMLSRQFQEDMPLNMYVLPVDPGAAIPDVFTPDGRPGDAPDRDAIRPDRADPRPGDRGVDRYRPPLDAALAGCCWPRRRSCSCSRSLSIP